MTVTRIPGRLFMMIIIFVIMTMISRDVLAQQPPPRPIHATLVQNMAFGAFSQGAAGGTVTINTDGSRTATGDVVLLNLGYTFNAATFRITANQGTVVSIILGADVTLPGSGGGSMTLHLNGTNPASPFVITVNPPTYTTIDISGTLTVGNQAASPPGDYSGTFDITFMQE